MFSTPASLAVLCRSVEVLTRVFRRGRGPARQSVPSPVPPPRSAPVRMFTRGPAPPHLDAGRCAAPLFVSRAPRSCSRTTRRQRRRHPVSSAVRPPVPSWLMKHLSDDFVNFSHRFLRALNQSCRPSPAAPWAAFCGTLFARSHDAYDAAPPRAGSLPAGLNALPLRGVAPRRPASTGL